MKGSSFLSIVITVLTSACGGGGGSSPSSPDNRLLGIDINESRLPGTSTKEGFRNAYGKAAEIGMDFITLPLNWRDIEPGPDDRFEFVPFGDQALNRKNWNRVIPPGATLETRDISVTGSESPSKLVWSETSADTQDGRIYTRYELIDPSFELSLDVNIVTPNNESGGYNVSLIANFTHDAASGNQCLAGDAYVAMTVTTVNHVHYLTASECQGSGLTTLSTIALNGLGSSPEDNDTLTLKLRRTVVGFEFLYDIDQNGLFEQLADHPEFSSNLVFGY